MTGPGLWLLFVAMGAVTLGSRASFLLLQDRAGLSPLLRRSLAYVPPAVLAAIVTPALFEPGIASLAGVDARLPAGLIAIAVAWRSKSVIATLGVGMGVLWILTAVAGGFAG